MGGTFSGWRWSKKTTVESCLALDTTDLKRLNLLVPGLTNQSGSLQWRSGADGKVSSSISYAVTIGAGTGTLRLDYTLKQSSESLDYPISLVTTGCHLGGLRWWFRCPLTCNGVACGRRVRKLYLRGRYFGCRRCHQLTYRSCQESDSRVYHALRAGMHLGGYGSVEGMSVTQLGFTLKVLTAGQKRIERDGKRMDRLNRKQTATDNEER
jgi:hypothetical protein